MPHTLSLLLAAGLMLAVPAQPPSDQGCPPADGTRVAPIGTDDAARLRLARCVRDDLRRGRWSDADRRLAAARVAGRELDGGALAIWTALVDRLVATRVVDARAWTQAPRLLQPVSIQTPWLATTVEALATARLAWPSQDADAFAAALAQALELGRRGAAADDLEIVRAARIVQAAVAGGQYERDEMQLLLDAARATEQALATTLGELYVPVVLAQELEADLLLQTNRYAAAAAAYREVIAAHPGRVQSWLGLADAYRRLGYTAEAATCQAEADRLAPGFAFEG